MKNQDNLWLENIVLQEAMEKLNKGKNDFKSKIFRKNSNGSCKGNWDISGPSFQTGKGSIKPYEKVYIKYYPRE